MSLKIAIIDDRSVTFRGLIDVLKDAASLELAGVFAAFADPLLLAYPQDALIAVGDPFAQPVRQPLLLPENLPVVIMSNSTDPDDVRAALRAGARGYLSKGASVTSLVQAIGAVAAGDFYLGSNPKLRTPEQADRWTWLILAALTQGLIGGVVELGESFEDAARRELFEESRLTAGSLRQLDVYSGPDFRLAYPNGDQAYVVGVTFLAGSVVGVAAPDGQEGFELGWFNPDHLPVLSGYNTLLTTRALASLARPRK